MSTHLSSSHGDTGGPRAFAKAEMTGFGITDRKNPDQEPGGGWAREAGLASAELDPRGKSPFLGEGGAQGGQVAVAVLERIQESQEE